MDICGSYVLKGSTGSALITNSIRQGTEFFNCSDWQIAPTSRSFAFDLKARRLNYRSVCLCDEEFHVKYISYINISYSQVLSYFDYYRLYRYIIHLLNVTSVFISLSCTDSRRPPSDWALWSPLRCLLPQRWRNPGAEASRSWLSSSTRLFTGEKAFKQEANSKLARFWITVSSWKMDAKKVWIKWRMINKFGPEIEQWEIYWEF